MISLLQNASHLIGSEKDIKSLEEKDSALVLVISDSHREASIVKAIVEDSPKCDALVFCGDGIGDVVSMLERTLKNKTFAQKVPSVIAFAEGNNDADRYPVRFNPKTGCVGNDVYYEIEVPKSVCLNVAGAKIYASHGHESGVYYGVEEIVRKSANADIVCFGHTHLATSKNCNGVEVLNPGSCAYPRGGLPPSFATIRISNEAKDVCVTFYEITVSLKNGVEFTPFIPHSITY